MIDVLSIALGWMPQDITDDKCKKVSWLGSTGQQAITETYDGQNSIITVTS